MAVTVLRPGAHAIITGGSSGIGLVTARHLAQAGMHLSILARDADRLARAKTDIARSWRNPEQQILTLSADVADRDQVEDAIGRAVDALGPPTLLIACAGIGITETFRETPSDHFETVMAINYLGAVHAVRAVLPAMIAAGEGHIVFVSSGAGLLGIYGYSAYSATKFALRGLAEALRMELKPLGIRVAIAYPPDTETPGFTEEERNKLVPTRRLTGAGGLLSADSVAQAIIAGIEAKNFAITPGIEMRLLYWLRAPFDSVVRWALDRLAGWDWPPRSARRRIE